MDLERQINLSRNSVKIGEAHVLSVQIPLEAMAIQDTYLRYNRERRYLVYWMTNAATKIRRNMQVESSMSKSPPGVVSLETLKSLSKLFAEHMNLPRNHWFFQKNCATKGQIYLEGK
jgi:hypothetical protein